MKAKMIIENITENTNYVITSDDGLLNFNRGLQSKSENTRPTYCVTASYGSVRLYDNNDTIERYANLGYLRDNKKVSLYLGNDLVGVYETSNFSKDGKIVSIELQDRLLRTKNIQIPFFLKEDYKSEGYANIGLYVKSLLESNGFEVSTNFANAISNLLSNKEESDFVLGSSLWDLLDKLCKALRICVFTNDKGQVDIDYQTSPKTLKIRNFDYFEQPKLNPFNNNQVDNVSIDRYWRKTNDDLINVVSSWNGVNKTSGIKFDLFYQASKNYYGLSYLYANTIENENYVRANEMAYKTYERTVSVANLPRITKANFMYLSFKIPLNKNEQINNFADYNGFSDSTIKLTCQTKEFINNAGSEANGVIGNYEISLNETFTTPNVLQDYRMFEELMDDLIGLDYTGEEENPISFTSYWYIRGGDFIELYILVPSNFFQDYKSQTSSGTLNYIREIVYEKFTLTINGIKTYQIESSETKLFIDKDVDLKLQGNELVTINNAQKIIEDVYGNWKNGKKTLNFTCYKGNYYDTNGNLVYNENSGETIKVGDIVNPYINSNGIEKPIGNIDSTSAIDYIVTSSEMEYNGNVKIHLELLEK